MVNKTTIDEEIKRIKQRLDGLQTVYDAGFRVLTLEDAAVLRRESHGEWKPPVLLLEVPEFPVLLLLVKKASRS